MEVEASNLLVATSEEEWEGDEHTNRGLTVVHAQYECSHRAENIFDMQKVCLIVRSAIL